MTVDSLLASWWHLGTSSTCSIALATIGRIDHAAIWHGLGRHNGPRITHKVICVSVGFTDLRCMSRYFCLQTRCGCPVSCATFVVGLSMSSLITFCLHVLVISVDFTDVRCNSGYYIIYRHVEVFRGCATIVVRFGMCIIHSML